MKKVLALCLLLAACGGSGGGGGGTSVPYPGRPDAIAGQWSDYGTDAGAGFVGHLSNPFAFPLQQNHVSANYIYTAPPSLAEGQTVILTYTISGTGTLGVADGNDTPPATVRLFIWGNVGDTLNDRWWCPTPVNLAVGTTTLACAIDNSWTGVNGQLANDQFRASLASPFAVGFTFGGQSFAGHGVWATGNVQFHVDSYGVQ